MSKKNSKKCVSHESKGLQNVSLRVYKGYAVVEGAYPVCLTKGTSTFQIEGLPTAYQPRSLRIDPFVGPGEVVVGPRRYRASNLTRDTLRELFLNKKVTVRYQTAKGEKTASGKYLGLDGNTVFLSGKKGALKEIPNFIAFEYNQLPDGVSNTPALEVTVTAEEKGDYEVNIAFKADGFNWDADYTLLYDEQNGIVDWEAEIHVSNQSGANFKDAEISVVAGDTNQQKAIGMAPMRMAAAASFDASGGGMESVSSRGSRSAVAESIGQVKEYKVPDRGDVVQGEDQTLDFFAAKGVEVKRELRVRSSNRWHAQSRSEAPVRTILQFTTGKETPLSMALPGGSVTLLQLNKAGKKVETGGASLRDTAVGEEIKLETGTDFDVKAVRLVKDQRIQEAFKALPVVEVEETDEQSAGFEQGPRMSASVSARKPKKPVKPYEKTTVVTKDCVFEVFNGKEFGVEVLFEEHTDAQLRLAPGHKFNQVASGRNEQTVLVPAGKKVQVAYTLVFTSVENVELTDEQYRAACPQK
jgi:hypothetical protein